ncbi:putative F-box protein [Acorus calamus]|uniref:F-box protein n=1 Tax=Acorus calamus TaxID=4465 RepID=A0AAV9FNJ1_ACOCL|nr:putative F-box protein [Acorus calamus]
MDFLSSLPDSLLILILSYLTFYDAWKTSELGLRYRHLWISTANFDFDEEFFVNSGVRHDIAQGVDRPPAVIRAEARAAFMRFLRNFFSRHQGRFASFRLRLSNPEEFEREVREWLEAVVRFNAESVDLCFSDWWRADNDSEAYAFRFELPDGFYRGDSITSLSLAGTKFDAESFRGFQNLVVLNIGKVSLSNEDVQGILLAVPTLRDLTLYKCMSDGFVIENSKKAAPITSLKVEECWPLSDGITLQMLKLRSFKYTGWLRQLVFMDMNSIEDVELDFCLEYEFDEIGDILQEMLVGLGRAKSLIVCSYLAQTISSGDEPLHLWAIQDDLRQLTMNISCHRYELPGISFMLRSYRNLEKFTVQICEERVLEDFEYPFAQVQIGRAFWNMQAIAPVACLRRTLKMVEVVGFKGTENELELLRYLLREGVTLRRVIIKTFVQPVDGNLNQIMVAAEQALNFPRGSANVEVTIVA